MNPGVRLGVNVDHVATVRRLRDTPYPDLILAADECVAGGAEQITVHLREDRRHIVDEDVEKLRRHLRVDLNLEMAATPEMLAIALRVRPHCICVVPEKREERTTEGGLDLSNPARHEFLATIASEARKAGIVCSFFIEPSPRDLETSKRLGATAVELHTGALCLAHQRGDKAALTIEWKRLHEAVNTGATLNLAVNAGHGIDYKTAPLLGAVRGIREFNIGHSIVAEALHVGIREATRRMKAALGGESL